MRARLLMEAQTRASLRSRAVAELRATRPAITAKGLEIAAGSGDKKAKTRLCKLFSRSTSAGYCSQLSAIPALVQDNAPILHLILHAPVLLFRD